MFSQVLNQRKNKKAREKWEKRRPLIVKMLAEGKTQKEIGKAVGASQWGVSNWMRKMGLKK